jgi:hypothetical protein
LKQRGVALDRSVKNELDAAKAETVGIALVQLGEIIQPAHVRDRPLLKDVDQWIENDPHRI